MEETYDRMFTVTSRLRLTVSKEDDGVAVICIIDHPAVKDFQAQKYLEVQCESLRHIACNTAGCAVLFLSTFYDVPNAKLMRR